MREDRRDRHMFLVWGWPPPAPIAREMTLTSINRIDRFASPVRAVPRVPAPGAGRRAGRGCPVRLEAGTAGTACRRPAVVQANCPTARRPQAGLRLPRRYAARPRGEARSVPDRGRPRTSPAQPTRASTGGWVSNRLEKPSRGLSMHISITAEVAPASSPRPSILRSAEIMASGFLVSSTEPASARNSR